MSLRFLDLPTHAVRRVMHGVAKTLDSLTGGRLHPNAVTMTGLFMHIPIAFLIADGRFGWAAVLLVVFGLFDTLDGELARLQHRVSNLGMLLDTVSDRVKEAMLYMGIGYYLVTSAFQSDKDVGYFAALAVAAVAGSLLVSYINAWGEVLLTRNQRSSEVNQTFRAGLMKYEIRMFLLVIGLLFDWLVVIVTVIALLSWVTTLTRLFSVSRRLNA